MSADSTVTIEYTAIPEYARWTLVLVHPKDLRAYGEFRMGFNLVHPETFEEGWEHPTMSGWDGDEEVFRVQLGWALCRNCHVKFEGLWGHASPEGFAKRARTRLD